MSRKTIKFCLILILTISSFSLSSCNNAGKVERFIDDIGYGSWDIDGDGVAGRSVNFRGTPTRTGHCRNCGLDHYGNYICEHFTPERPGSTTCVCGCSMKSHAQN